METARFYKILFFVGSGWNFTTSIAMFLLIGSLPAMIGIAEPNYPVFIYFNLMSIFFFGCIQWTVARHLESSRSFIKILVWAKIFMVIVFAYGMLIGPFSKELFGFLLPGMFIDLFFGLMFWRFLFFSRRLSVVGFAPANTDSTLKANDSKIII